MSIVSVITGAAGGIGAATARRLANRGPLLLADRFEEPLALLADQLRRDGARVATQFCDVADPASVRNLVARASSTGPIGGFAHLAGISSHSGDWESVVRVDLLGTAYVAREVLAAAGSETALVCAASMAGHRPVPDALLAILEEPLAANFMDRIRPFVDDPEPRSAYAAAKRGVLMLCRRQARAFGQKGARIVSISPGFIDTLMTRRATELRPVIAEQIKGSTLHRIGRPEEVAAAVDFLSGPDASFITGCDLLVDGGVTGGGEVNGDLRWSGHLTAP